MNSSSKRFALTLLIYGLGACQMSSPVDYVDSLESTWALQGFVKLDSVNPILEPSLDLRFNCPVVDSTVHWEARNVLNPAAVVRGQKVYLLYRAQDQHMTSRLGLATSEDGWNFHKQADPVFYPQSDTMQIYEWPGGVEDPRIVESEDGRYILTYTAYDGKTARLCLASSRDLKTWSKHGPVLTSEKYLNTWSKSGAIVVKQVGSRMVAAKINGKYWMYFGDTNIFLASSEDLIHWEAVEDHETTEKIAVLHPRKGYFDSRLVEPGPFALLREEGILLIYNASNAASHNDPSLPKYTYAAGQALYDKENPHRLIDRTTTYFIHPDKPYEKIGEVNEVCFVEGLVYFQDQWILYYGTADSKIAAAVSIPKTL